MSEARANILSRLRVTARPVASVAEPEAPATPEFSRADKIAQLKQRMEAMHAEVIVSERQQWLATLKDVLRRRSLNGLLHGPNILITWLPRQIKQWPNKYWGR